MLFNVSVHFEVQANTYVNINNVSHAPFVPSLFENAVNRSSIILDWVQLRTIRDNVILKLQNGTGVPALHATDIKSVAVQAGNLIVTLISN